ncbi:major facilitator superfamily domain-containing protein [Fomitopsis serialis]|uniref:major facilitator superfamily domain-containing protein n=1 Tax=Fomitopsis serialis TaxID=139415 RepID=UPI002007F3E5|nr:major facilitator superfamily domain-containing protein [Neoantrodia serialis]KAH9932471.1 major facilitator superfamily domain-containing protein [Neoantrodia serialis]
MYARQGQFLGQIAFGLSCDRFGQKASLSASAAMILVGAVLCTAARGLHGGLSGLLWFVTVARGIIGVGIGGIYTSACTIAFEAVDDMTTKKGRVFVLMTNVMFSAGAPLATIVFLVVLSAARPEHLATVWPVCTGIGIVIPLAAICYSSLRDISERYGRRIMGPDLSVYSLELRRNWAGMARTCCLWFVYNFVAYPKIVLSGVILYTIVDGDLWRTAGFELLLGVFALCGSWVGAMWCDAMGRRNIMLVSLAGYVVFALIIGCAYDRLVKIVPLLVVLYALMLFMGNLGPGNMLSLIALESYPRNFRGSFYGVTAAFGTAGALAGIHAFNTIDENLRKQWGFIIAALCGALGIVIAYFLPAAPDVTSASLSEKEATAEDDHVATPAASHTRHNGSPMVHPKQSPSVDKDDGLDTNDDFVPCAHGSSGLRGMPGDFSVPSSDDGTSARQGVHHAVRSGSTGVVAHTSAQSAIRRAIPQATEAQISDAGSGLLACPEAAPSRRVMLLQRMPGSELQEYSAPALDVQEAHEVITEHVAASGLQKFFKANDTFVKTVEANAAQLKDDGRSFPVTRQNVTRLIRLSLYHPVLYCDDSGSMTLDSPTRWVLQRNVVARIANITTRVLPHPYGVSLRFINAVWAAQDNIPASHVLNAVDRVSPDGGTPLGTNLRNHVLQPLVYDVLDRPDHRARLLERPLLICVVTDGCPGDYEIQFEDAIAECRQRLVRAGYEPTAVRFCVNQIGNDAGSTMFLERLRSNPNIQDIVYCTTERIDEKFQEFRDNERQLDEWLLRMLSDPIMHNTSTGN